MLVVTAAGALGVAVGCGGGHGASNGRPDGTDATASPSPPDPSSDAAVDTPRASDAQGVVDATGPGDAEAGGDGGGRKLFALSGRYPHGFNFVGDVTGDGNVDLILLAPDPSLLGWTTFSVWKGNGNGTFAATPKTTSLDWTSPPLPSNTLATGDATGDGRWDLSFTGRASDASSAPLTFRTIAGQVDGSFTLTPTSQIDSGASYYDVCKTTADVTGDGKPDVVIVKVDDAQSIVSILVAGTTSSDKATTLNASFGFASCNATGDLDGDGKTDLGLTIFPKMQGGYGPGSAVVLYGNGDGSFTAPVDLGQVGLRAFGDADGDGKADLLLRTPASNAGQIMWSDARGTFAPGPVQPFVFLGDFDGDGKVDVLDSNAYATAFSFGQGARGFGRRLSSPVPFFAAGAAVDLDGDGTTDLVTQVGVTDVYLSTAKHVLTTPADNQCPVDGDACGSVVYTSF